MTPEDTRHRALRAFQELSFQAYNVPQERKSYRIFAPATMYTTVVVNCLKERRFTLGVVILRGERAARSETSDQIVKTHRRAKLQED